MPLRPALVLPLLLTLAGCGAPGEPAPERPRKELLLGRWQEGAGSQDPVLLLDAELRFQAFNWPATVLDPAAAGAPPRVDGSGRWNLQQVGGQFSIALRWERLGAPLQVAPLRGVLLPGEPPALRFGPADDGLRLQRVDPER